MSRDSMVVHCGGSCIRGIAHDTVNMDTLHEAIERLHDIDYASCLYNSIIPMRNNNGYLTINGLAKHYKSTRKIHNSLADTHKNDLEIQPISSWKLFNYYPDKYINIVQS